MARAMISEAGRHAAWEPLYDIDPVTGATVEVFFADRVLAQSFGACGPGWFWWTCQSGCLANCPPAGPFASAYSAYRNWAEAHSA
jgi:hypothetical protein